ncbi:MAG: response regulator transcription factor [Planctomycetes bacterium]|nr:response regulator transcription factor [Planctomycetota bacterium]
MEALEGTVFVVDDDPDIRHAMRRLLDEVHLPVSEFSDARHFLDEFERGSPGCIILDVRMPGMSGIELQKRLQSEGVSTPVIIVTGHGDIPMAVDAVQRGAFDFLEKPFAAQALLDRIQDALRYDRELRELGERRTEIEERYARLTPREREVIDLVVTGKTNKQIAADLGVSSQAIDARRANAMRKLGTTNIPELTEFMLRYREDIRSRPQPELR